MEMPTTTIIVRGAMVRDRVHFRSLAGTFSVAVGWEAERGSGRDRVRFRSLAGTFSVHAVGWEAAWL